MESEIVKSFAKDMLNLSLTDSDSTKLTQNLARLKELVRIVEGVPLPFLGDPFIMPAVGDAWLETWPNEAGTK